MRKLQRSINMGFRVTEEEQALIHDRMERLGFQNLRAYLVRMAINGYILSIDQSDIQECTRLLRIVSNNVNQYAKRANETGSIYAADIADVQTRLGEVWEQQNSILRGIAKVLEAV